LGQESKRPDEDGVSFEKYGQALIVKTFSFPASVSFEYLKCPYFFYSLILKAFGDN